MAARKTCDRVKIPTAYFYNASGPLPALSGAHLSQKIVGTTAPEACEKDEILPPEEAGPLSSVSGRRVSVPVQQHVHTSS
eukprot:scaffold168455_cov21-Tisochrysis_lutea.AAC.1